MTAALKEDTVAQPDRHESFAPVERVLDRLRSPTTVQDRLGAANRCIRRETPSLCGFDHSVFRLLQESDDMLSRDRREPLEKIID